VCAGSVCRYGWRSSVFEDSSFWMRAHKRSMNSNLPPGQRRSMLKETHAQPSLVL